MRRGASILLLLFFLLGPLAAAVGDDDASLPPCCRRNGAHHCSMARLREAIVASGKPIVTAPSTCPNYPGDNALTAAPLDAAPRPVLAMALVSAFCTELPAAAAAGELVFWVPLAAPPEVLT